MNLGRLLVFAPFLPLVRKVFKQLVEQRHKHQRQRRGKYHAANRHRANFAPAAGPGTGGDTSGNMPTMKARAVMTMARKRCRAALMAASVVLRPVARFWAANSTIRMAFLAARPISTSNPT